MIFKSGLLHPRDKRDVWRRWCERAMALIMFINLDFLGIDYLNKVGLQHVRFIIMSAKGDFFSGMSKVCDALMNQIPLDGQRRLQTRAVMTSLVAASVWACSLAKSGTTWKSFLKHIGTTAGQSIFWTNISSRSPIAFNWLGRFSLSLWYKLDGISDVAMVMRMLMWWEM